MKFSKFFSNLQEAPWYRDFLDPVIDEIDKKGKVLDIGTGSDKLIQIFYTEKSMNCIGVDTSNEMLKEAKIKLDNKNIQLIKIEENQKLPFENNSFDYITICSVLFHLKNKDIALMLKDIERLLKENGKIIVLTPTGKGNILKLSRNYFSVKNLGIYIWYLATKKRSEIWSSNKYLEQYARKNKLKYRLEIVMNGFAQIEILK